MIGMGIFIVVYLLSIWLCNVLDEATGINEGNSFINYIPFVNTLLLVACLIGAVLWWVVELVRYGNKKKEE